MLMFFPLCQGQNTTNSLVTLYFVTLSLSLSLAYLISTYKVSTLGCISKYRSLSVTISVKLLWQPSQIKIWVFHKTFRKFLVYLPYG